MMSGFKKCLSAGLLRPVNPWVLAKASNNNWLLMLNVCGSVLLCVVKKSPQTSSSMLLHLLLSCCLHPAISNKERILWHPPGISGRNSLPSSRPSFPTPFSAYLSN